jgi:hypothetical protein
VDRLVTDAQKAKAWFIGQLAKRYQIFMANAHE